MTMMLQLLTVLTYSTTSPLKSTTNTATTSTSTSYTTLTQTSTSTSSDIAFETTLTTVTSTATVSTTSGVQRRNQQPQTTAVLRLEDRDSRMAELEERDRIVVSGTRPSYASSCRNVQAVSN